MAEISCLNAAIGERFAAYLGDCVSVVAQLPANSVDFSVYSPPFSGLYIYNDSIADMGNTANDAEFFEQYRFLIREKLRVTRPGRLSAIHVKDLVYYSNTSAKGDRGLRDFSGECIRAHKEAAAAAKRNGIEIRYYNIIYDLVDDVKAAMSGLLKPERRETFIGYATIKEVFQITKVGKVAGCMVTEGLVKRGGKVRLTEKEASIIKYLYRADQKVVTRDILRTNVYLPDRTVLWSSDRAIIGQLVSRVTNDTEAVKTLYVQVMFVMLDSVIVVCGALAAMAWLNWRLALVVMLLVGMAEKIVPIIN